MGEKRFRKWEIDQPLLFPPSVKDFVGPDHLAHFVRDLVRTELDLSGITSRYRELRGQPPYHPALMTALLLYAYSRGIYSSRRIEQSCEERADFMAVTAMEKPDHSTICQFRNDHREALCGLFVQVLALCRDAGLAKLGHVALDGTKVRANASKHAAMSYARMVKAEPELAKLVREWMEEAKSTDEEEDDEHGPGSRGDEIPEHVKAKMKKLLKMQAAMFRLEEEAEEEAERVAKERAEKEAERGHKLGGTKPRALSGEPEDKAQSNFTESRIMRTNDGYVQAYNGQAAVDAESQVIVACSLTNRQNDERELLPLVDQVKSHLGEHPREVSADSSYCSEANLAGLRDREVRGYVATGRQRHGESSATSRDRGGPLTQGMRRRLRLGGWRSRYRLRKQVVEPVFGQIKEARGFRRFLHRGLEKVRAEWTMLCTTHNLLKLAHARAASAG
jgi:transposase